MTGQDVSRIADRYDTGPARRREFRARADFLACAHEVRVKKDHATLTFVRLEAGPGRVGVIVTGSDGGRVFTSYDEFGHVDGGPINLIIPQVFLKQASAAAKGADGFGIDGDEDGKLRITGHAPPGQGWLDCEYSVPFALKAEALTSGDTDWFKWRSVVGLVKRNAPSGPPPCIDEAHTKTIAKLANLLGAPGWTLARGGHEAACAISFPDLPDALLIVMAIDPPGLEQGDLWEVPKWSV